MTPIKKLFVGWAGTYVDLGTTGTDHDGRAHSVVSMLLLPARVPGYRRELEELAEHLGDFYYYMAPELSARTWVEVVVGGERKRQLLVTTELSRAGTAGQGRVRTRIIYWGAPIGELSPKRRRRKRRREQLEDAHRAELSALARDIGSILSDFREATRPATRPAT